MTVYSCAEKKRGAGGEKLDVVSTMVKNAAEKWHALTHPARHHFPCHNHLSARNVCPPDIVPVLNFKKKCHLNC